MKRLIVALVVMQVVLIGLLLLFDCPVWAENWQLANETYFEAIPDLDMPASTTKTYVDVDSIEKYGSRREYWEKKVDSDSDYDTGKAYIVFDCARRRGAIKIYTTGDVVPDHKLQWYPVCTGNEPPPSHMFHIQCLPFYEHKFVCGK